ncbi:plasma membrane ATPase 4 [Ceratobasidium sp. AG-Ba]|nr:plasma membrane ATPase 4 [Ceratobasidium sp. AG-Ba]
MTPDLLHQLHKGVMKDHLTKWVTKVLGKQVFDEQHATMPEYHGMHHFKHRITGMSQWTGCELKEMAKVLLPAAANRDPLVAAARALLNFMYPAHLSALTDMFRELGAVKMKEAFHGIPKIHMIQHYVKLIKVLGTPDGYNTETLERLHIDFAKMGYCMALYIQRVEAMAMHKEYLQEKGVRVNTGLHTLPCELGNKPDNPDNEDEWDEWQEEEDEEEDPNELQDTRVRVVMDIEISHIQGI